MFIHSTRSIPYASIIIMKKITCFVCALFVMWSTQAQNKDITYTVPAASWPEQFGNHRAVINIKEPADAVHINFLWRRHDKDPETRKMQIVSAATGTEVPNIHRVYIDKERCELVFGPVKEPGEYYFYYLPYTPELKQYSPGYYLDPEKKPAASWTQQHALADNPSAFHNVQEATVKQIQARSSFDSFYPMEVTATAKEVDSFLHRNTADFLVFAEDRTYPIRMPDALPLRWIEKQPSLAFTGHALKNEYYAFQLGVIAAHKNIENIKPVFSDLKDAKGNTIPLSAITCFNTTGVDTKGKPFTKKVHIIQGKVQPLWIGIDIPAGAAPGNYQGMITLAADNAKEQTIKLQLSIADSTLPDRGDGETWRHSRLRWLNSTLGINDNPTLRYKALQATGNRIEATGKSVLLDSYGLPAQINITDKSILAAPVQFAVEINNRVVVFPAGKFSITEKKPGIIKWKSRIENDSLLLECNGEMEFDGRLSYKYRVQAKIPVHIQDIRIAFPMKKKFATYLVGMGRMGGYTPKNHISRWLKTEDSFWIGETSGGLQCELRGGRYHGPLLNLYQPNPPASWFNGVNGGFRIDSDEQTVTASAYSGARKMNAGQSVDYEFAVLLTPVKAMDMKKQFTERYFHSPYPTPEVIANGGNVMNIHHANPYNPFINYPFIAQKEMKGITEQWHAKGWKVKIYYTVRELSNHLTEIWALRSLGNEVLSGGDGGGYQWLQEHLVTDYSPQWYTHLGNGVVDAAILNGSESRWYNYYIEGLNWLVKNMDIDGLYLDDVSFDRNIIKRMRKVMELTKPDCMIDLHSNTAFSLGSMNQNLEMFPFIDKTWFGEGFNFDLMPADFWLTEVSGIPFGIGNDVLMHMSVNNRRGMSFGMTHRGFVPMWKLWDEFGIAEAQMRGYWEKTPVVTTDHKNIVATAYVKKGKTLIAVGSWENKPATVHLKLNWKVLGLDPAKVNITAPAIDDYQVKRTYKPGEPILIDAKGDCLLIVSER